MHTDASTAYMNGLKSMSNRTKKADCNYIACG